MSSPFCSAFILLIFLSNWCTSSSFQRGVSIGARIQFKKSFIITQPNAYTHTKVPNFTTNSQQVLNLVPEVVGTSYDFAAGSAVIGTIFGALENFKGKLGKLFGAGAIIFTLFGGFLAFQTSTLRFQFDDEKFSLVKADNSALGENVVVGGENAWRYDSFVNYGFLPSESFPILVYFKEIQTPRDNWVTAPIVVDNLEGQAHFFPAIANVQQLSAGFKSHNCAKLIE